MTVWLRAMTCLALAACGAPGVRFEVSVVEPAPAVDEATLQIVFTGAGNGTVSAADGGWSCAESCSVRLPASQPVVVVALSDDDSLPPTLSGACVASPCTLSAPASLEVSFERARRVELSLPSDGVGRVDIAGLGSCSSSCSMLVPTTTALILTATPRDELVSFRGFGGACSGTGDCFIDAGETLVEVSAAFEPVLLWSRSFPVFGGVQQLALHADDTGIILAMSTTGGLEVDGSRIQSAQVTNPWSAFVELEWDAGVRWAVPMPGRGATASDRIPVVTRLANGDVVAGGSCMGGQLAAVDCGPAGTSRPLAVRILDGGISELATRSAEGSVASITVVDGGVLLRELVRGVGSRLSSWQGGDLNTAPTADYPGFFPFSDSANNECSMDNEKLVCAFALVGSVNANGCLSTSAGAAGAVDVGLIELDGIDRCAVRTRFNALGVNGDVGARSLCSAPGGLLLAGDSTSATQLGSTTLSGPSHWLARLDAFGGLTEVASSPSVMSGDRSLVDSAVWGPSGLVVLGRGNVPDSWFGRLFAAPTTFIATFDANDLSRRTRTWALTDSGAPERPRARMARVGDLIVVAISGVGLRLGDQFLSTDSQPRIHVLVFRG